MVRKLSRALLDNQGLQLNKLQKNMCFIRSLLQAFGFRYWFRRLLIVNVAFWLASELFGQDPQNNLGLGLRPPTAEESTWMDEKMQNTKIVRLNTLGLERINDDRRSKGQPALANTVTVPIGDEPMPESPFGQSLNAVAEAVQAMGAALPTAVDNSLLPSFPMVQSQGDLGSCAAFSTTYYAGTHMTGLVRGWISNNADLTTKLSPKWTYNFVNGGSDTGTWFTSVFDVMLKLGAPTLSDWPYSGVKNATNYLEWPRTAAIWRSAINNRFSTVGRVQDIQTDAGRETAKALINNGYVLLYGTDIHAWRFTTLANDPGTSADNAFSGQPVCYVVKDYTKISNGAGSGHAMTIVGYNDDIWTDINKNGVVDTGEKGAFKIVNSWGLIWGTPNDSGQVVSVTNNGFAWISYDALRAASLVPVTAAETYFSLNRAGGTSSYRSAFWGNEVYWISARASYTPTLLAQFTVSHPRRNQMTIKLGVSTTSTTTPVTYWPVTTTAYNGWLNGGASGPQVFQNLGGAYAFDGSTTALNGTFVFDLTDLTTNGNQRYYLEVTDTDATTGTAASVSDFRLLSTAGTLLGTASNGIPLSANNSTARAYLDYSTGGSVPAITSATSTSGVVGQAFSYTITGSNTPTGFSATGLPAGLSVNSSTGVISGTPSQAGQLSVSLGASNAAGTGTGALSLTVNSAQVAAPQITSSTTALGTVGQIFSYTITASNTPTSYSASSLPQGLSVNTSTGVIAGTPTQSGSFPVSLAASNAGGTGASRTLTLSIAAAAQAAPVITSAGNVTGASGTSFSYRIEATNSPTSYNATGLPSGISINNSTGVISGLLSVARSYEMTVQATNTGGSGYKGVLLFVSGASSFGPANDAFSNRIALSGTSATVAGSNVNGSAETGEPAHAGAAVAKSIWYAWTAPASGSVTVSTVGSNFDTVLALYTGTAVGALTAVASDDQSGGNNTSLLTTNVIAGTNYKIAVDGKAAAEGAVQLSLGFTGTSGPANNTFANRISVAGASVTASGSNVGATAETGEPAHAGNTAVKSIWWTWTAPQSGRYVIDTIGSTFDTVLAVYTGSALNGLALTAADDEGGGDNTSRVAFNATSGTVYQIAVDGWNGAQGAIQLHIAPSVSPTNDNFASRTSVSGAAVATTGTNAGATAESGEPGHARNTATKSVWWTWTAPQTGLVSVDTSGSRFDTLLAVYTGSNLTALSPVAANDDITGDGTSLVSFNVTSGTSYQIAVDGWHGAEGTLNLHIAFASASPPANDSFASRRALTGNSATATLSTLTATAQTGEPAHAGNAASKSVWWTWTAPQAGRLTISTSGSNFDTVLAVYTGSVLTGLTSVVSNDDADGGSTSSVTMFVLPGTIYSIAVDGYGGDAGNVELSLEFIQTNELYSVNFEGFLTGADQLAGTDGWLSSASTGGMSGIFYGFGGIDKTAWLGFNQTSSTSVLVWRPFNYDPVTGGTPKIEFQVDLGLVDSTNGKRDSFYFILYNQLGQFICGLGFDNSTQRLIRADGVSTEDVGGFSRRTRYTLNAVFDFATNRWSASLGGTVLFTNKIMTAVVNRRLDLGDMAVSWLISEPGTPGNNYLTFDNFVLRIPIAAAVIAPKITTQPSAASATAGSSTTFSVVASGTGPFTYQWYKSGSAINGATSASYTINSAATSDAGSYSVIVTNSAGSVTSNSATLTLGSSRLYALSVRSYSGSGGDTLIMGVVVSGSGTKNLIARGIGPNLSFYGVSGFLADPQLKLYSIAGTLMQTNDDWGGGNTLTNAFASVGLAALPAASKDAAFLLNQSPGVFTMHLTSVTGTGIGLMELYDSGSDTDSSKLSALSVRGQVGTGANVLIVGFVISGSASKQFIIRGVGPNLAASGVTGYMNDPQLTLFNSSGAQIGSNDDWGGGSTLSNAFTSVGLASMPAASKDAAMLVTLAPGVYTVQLSGVNSTTGVGLIEFYEAP